MTGTARDWTSAWPDALAFVIGLTLAWWLDWRTTDLVWSLWLSSLCVGYTLIVVSIFRPTWDKVREARANGASVPATLPIAGLFLAGALFLLAFFTVHFGGFHFVHSVFLHQFFPVVPHTAGFPGWAAYREVVARYWFWLPVAFLSERLAFRRPAGSGPAPAMGSADMMVPYKNVVRMHLLIFFFAFASFAKLENFAVYAAVYAVYFFPWRLVFPAKLTPTAS